MHTFRYNTLTRITRRGGGAMGVIVIWMLMVLASLCTLATTYKVLTDYLASPATQHPLSDDFIDNINNLAVSWEVCVSVY